MREKKLVAKIDIWEEREKYCLCRLPVELLLIILSYLSVIDSLSFRSVCKCWRSAFLNCPVPIPQSEAQRWLPWFVLLRIQDLPGKLFENERPLLYTTGKLGDLSTQRIFTPDIPELCGTQFLLSKHGWLLLFSAKGSSLFFLNPFSRTRIDLPFKDISKACSPVFDISAPPTSSECMVFVISCADEINFEISTCCRGESAWTTKVYGGRMLGSCRPVRAVFVEGIWYCLHEYGYFSAFDAVKCNWKYLGLPKNMCSLSADSPVSYVMKHGEQVHLNVHDAIGYEVVLKEPLEAIQRRGCNVFWLGDFEFSFRTCFKGAILRLQDQLQVDSFNAHAWCGTCDSEDKWMEFHWHRFRSFVDNNWYPLKGKRCPRDNCYMVAWLEPQLIHCSPNLDWSSHT